MGVLTKVRNGVVSGATKAVQVAGDGIAKASQLSPAQVKKLDDRRAEYLLEMPSMDDEVAEELTNRNLGAISIEINNSYLPQISDLYLPIEEVSNFDSLNRIGFFDITKWAKDPDEDNIEKLMNVYHVLSEEDCNIALIFNRSKSGCEISLAVVNNGKESDPSEIESYIKRIRGAIKGNFPGAQMSKQKAGIPQVLELNDDEFKSVAIVSNMATEKSEKFSIQTIEKVIDGIIPKTEKEEYTIILLATPIKEQHERKNRLYELYNALAPYSGWQTNFTFSQTDGVSSSATFGVNIGASAGKQTGVSRSEGISRGETYSETISKNDSITSSESLAESKNHTNSKSITKSENISNSESTARSKSQGINIGGAYQNSGGKTKTSTVTNGTGSAETKGSSETIGYSKTTGDAKTKAVGKAIGIAKTVAKTTTDTVSSGMNFGVNAGINFARSSNVTATLGKNEGITQTFVNYGIKHTLELLEKQIERLEESSALGLWDFAAYFVSGDSIVVNNAAHTYLALTQGDKSFFAESAVNLWRGDLPERIDEKNERGQAKNILVSLSRLQHPEFCLKYDGINGITDDYLIYPSCVTATTSLSGKELARALNFPSKSVGGVPVIETASFGRSVSSYNIISSDFSLGKIYHMHTAEEDQIVQLSKKSLASHTFVTGSTGSGKTNTVTSILKKLVLDNGNVEDTHFLIIEPAKGEYKDILGGYSGVSVYGTNPNFSKLLRLNPFSFPINITVGEHIDRLVEIFNVCWPMYAAMPAIMKDAIIRSYEVAGWDIDNSVNEINDNLFPSFSDVMEQVKMILNNSEYSSDTKGDYTGALVSRLKSLTNGINGQIFTANALSDDELFDKNVIVDMSRVGSVETKSLIMGLLVLKLQEYRLSDSKSDSKGLKHITVLEEAHNLLRRTSIEQSSESSNLLGKSVEMLTNSIAELRAFGEGFIIADQAPGLLDMAVIRNTNTKIIHRLPDYSDRELVGKSIGLNDNQIIELAKLELGVAAVYQNDWVESVLCKVDEFKEEYKQENTEKDTYEKISTKKVKQHLADYLINEELKGKGNKAELQRLAKIVMESQLSANIKRYLLLYINADRDVAVRYLRKIMYDLFDMRSAVIEADKESKIDDWVTKLIDKLNPTLRNYSKEQEELVVAMLVNEQYERDGSYQKIFRAYDEIYRGKGGSW